MKVLKPAPASSGRAVFAVKVLSWLARIVAAVILLQTLYFKFTAAPEPWGRIGSGVLELIAAILLLTPRFTWLGSCLAACAMAGAILSHLTLLVIEVQGDKGLLFGLAITVSLASLTNLYLWRRQIPLVGAKLA
jgi:putative oxidoreductase